MADTNQAVFEGELARDPEHKTTKNGHDLAKFTIKVQKGKGTAFISCVAWGKVAEAMKSFHANSRIRVKCHIETGSYDNQKTGQKVYTTDAVVDEIKAPKDTAPSADQGEAAHEQAQEGAEPPSQITEEDKADVGVDDVQF